MANKEITWVKGRAYDKATGLPISDAPKTEQKVERPAHPESTPATGVHARTQRSTTVMRRVTKKPVPASRAIKSRPQPGRHMDIARHGRVAKFAPNPVIEKPAAVVDAPASIHSVAAKALSSQPKRAPKQSTAQLTSVVGGVPIVKKTTPATSKQIKENEIAKALDKGTPKEPKKKFFASKHVRLLTIGGASLIVFIAAIYVTYTNIPSLSVSIAAAQAGIAATYPSYHPDGYSLVQPVTNDNGKVVLHFKANGGTTHFTISETRSSWDETAVLQNVVTPVAGNNFTTTEEQGLTLYSYNNGQTTTWVNGGILYTIDGNAPLSSEQIGNIATSM